MKYLLVLLEQNSTTFFTSGVYDISNEINALSDFITHAGYTFDFNWCGFFLLR